MAIEPGFGWKVQMEEVEANVEVNVRTRDLQWLSKAAEQNGELVISAAIAMVTIVRREG